MQKTTEREYIEVISEIPNDWDAQSYVYWGKYHPYEFSGWQDETLSWKQSAYIHAGLGICLPITEIEGADVLKLLSDLAVNSFSDFNIGSVKHVVMCNELGHVMVHGVALRLSENLVRCVDLDPYLSFMADTLSYELQGESTSCLQQCIR